MSALAELAVLTWKLCEAHEREVALATEDRRDAGEALLRFTRRKLGSVLDAEGLSLRTYDGDAWSAQLPPSPLNAADFGDCAVTVERTLEPTILAGSNVIVAGKVLLKAA